MTNLPAKQSTRQRHAIRWVGIGAVFVLVLAATYLIVGGRLVVLLKEPTQTASLRSVVCDSALIKKYNEAFSVDTQDERAQRFTEVISDIKQLSSTEDDPNCVYMQYTYNLEKNDIPAAQSSADKLLAHARDGRYISGELNNPMSIELIEKSVVWAKQTPAGGKPGDTSQGALN